MYKFAHVSATRLEAAVPPMPCVIRLCTHKTLILLYSTLVNVIEVENFEIIC